MPKNNQKKKQKTEIVWNEDARKEYLLGFHKRKQERIRLKKEKYQQKLKHQEKEEKIQKKQREEEIIKNYYKEREEMFKFDETVTATTTTFLTSQFAGQKTDQPLQVSVSTEAL